MFPNRNKVRWRQQPKGCDVGAGTRIFFGGAGVRLPLGWNFVIFKEWSLTGRMNLVSLLYEYKSEVNRL